MEKDLTTATYWPAGKAHTSNSYKTTHVSQYHFDIMLFHFRYEMVENYTKKCPDVQRHLKCNLSKDFPIKANQTHKFCIQFNCILHTPLHILQSNTLVNKLFEISSPCPSIFSIY